MNNKELSPYYSFFSILRNRNPLEKDYNNYQNLVNSGLTSELAVAKLRMDRKTPTGVGNYSWLQSVWDNIRMQYFSDFQKWCKNKDVVPALEEMQKRIEFYHNKGIDMLNLDVDYLIWPIIVCKNWQIPSLILLQSRIKICLRRYEKIWLVLLLFSLHVKL